MHKGLWWGNMASMNSEGRPVAGVNTRGGMVRSKNEEGSGLGLGASEAPLTSFASFLRALGSH
jgi:hypothetical protein